MSRTTDAGDAPRGERGPSRRILLRTGFTAVVAAGTAAVLIPLHDHTQDTAAAPARGPGRTTAGAAGAEEFAEMYRGREIRGGVSVLVPAAGPGGGAHHAEPVAEIRIDGRPLHVMRRADGTYLSDVTHYESFPTLRETARAAVDELGTARLALPASHHR
ncbi:tyrosinase family oxidase copper chaperone [Streptomyces sp. CFMR 7]|uniref:tyrosinase family oxidase copper chaperone n=1 Tax=Streptomyces sp. CFMR 7 TaxID=1649184 RepID=UPI0011A96A02|nr:tyrosinase family oxidase copper chaperone [Streptomyces sp. CFMR 7]